MRRTTTHQAMYLLPDPRGNFWVARGRAFLDESQQRARGKIGVEARRGSQEVIIIMAPLLLLVGIENC